MHAAERDAAPRSRQHDCRRQWRGPLGGGDGVQPPARRSRAGGRPCESRAYEPITDGGGGAARSMRSLARAKMTANPRHRGRLDDAARREIRAQILVVFRSPFTSGARGVTDVPIEIAHPNHSLREQLRGTGREDPLAPVCPTPRRCARSRTLHALKTCCAPTAVRPRRQASDPLLFSPVPNLLEP